MNITPPCVIFTDQFFSKTDKTIIEIIQTHLLCLCTTIEKLNKWRKKMAEYENLPFTNSFMFYKILGNNKQACIGLIERLLGIEIKDIEYLNAEH